MKDARIPLYPNLVGGCTHKCAVVFVVFRRVRQLGGGPVSGLVRSSARHPDEIRRVVEGPLKLDIGAGIGNHLAHHVHDLILANPVNNRTLVFAHRNI